jgi:release factor glutamine methyltransferase
LIQPDLSSRFVPLGQMLIWAEGELKQGGIQSARLDAELLLGAVLGLTRAQVLARTHTTVRRYDRNQFAALVHRRKRGEPVAYILGKKEFYGRDFRVDHRVLIPRPETEELVDLCLDVLEGRESPRVADVGVGSGAIAVTIAAEMPTACVDAVDISSGALAVAEENARRHNVVERIVFHQGSLLEPLVREEPYDLIVANLPYVGTSEIETLEPDVREFEPHLALFAGESGLDLFPSFFEQARAEGLLRPDGVILLEIGYAQGEPLAHLARGYFPIATEIMVQRDLAGHQRFIKIRP